MKELVLSELKQMWEEGGNRQEQRFPKLMISVREVEDSLHSLGIPTGCNLTHHEPYELPSLEELWKLHAGKSIYGDLK